MSVIYHIGEAYRYPRGKQIFILKEVGRFWFTFECGHGVSECVFQDLIRLKTGLQVCDEIQLDIFTESYKPNPD